MAIRRGDAVIGAEGKQQPTIVLWQQPRLDLVPPAPQDMRGGIAPDPQIVAGQVVPRLAGGRAGATDPAQAGIVAGSVNETVAEEADADR